MELYPVLSIQVWGIVSAWNYDSGMAMPRLSRALSQDRRSCTLNYLEVLTATTRLVQLDKSAEARVSCPSSPS